MKITVDHILEKPLELHAEEPVDTFPLLAGMQADGDCVFIGPVRYTIRAVREYDHLRVNGHVNVPISLVCSRCLASYGATIESSFTIIFRKGAVEQTASEGETELSEHDLISATYSGDEIDLTHEIEEQVAMEVPVKPLCGDGCKGLCVTCGTDLNQGDCSCPREQTNFRFSALKNFKVNG